jgi:hypothetical protein
MKRLFAAAAAVACVMTAGAASASIGGAGVAAATASWLQGAQDFRLVNRTGFAITHLYISASSETDWGDDILGVDILPNGQNADIEFDPEDDRCLWDIHVTYEDGDKEDYRQVNLCSITTITLTPDAATAS